MPDDPDPPPPAPSWDPEERLFGPRLSHGGQPHAPGEPLDDALTEPLFRDAEGAGSRNGRDVAPDPVAGAWRPVEPRSTKGLARHEPAPEDGAGGPADAHHPSGSHRAGDDDDPQGPGDDLGAGANAGGSQVGAGPDTDAAVFPRSERKPKPERSGSGSFFRELPVLLLIAFVLAFLLRTFVLQVFYIPSSSMEPTLMVNDRMAVEKVTYQFRDPRRGEIVVFEGDSLGEPDPAANLGTRVVRGIGQFLGVVPASARDYVKRVIGLPGDEIYIEDGQLFVNDVAIDEPYVVFPDGASYGPVTVPADSLFFLGDNRPNSSDSRRGLGFVPMDDVVGRSVVIIWPPENMGSLTGVEHELPDDG